MTTVAPQPETAKEAKAHDLTACLFGAAPDTSNLGVTALYMAVTTELAKRVKQFDLTVFDHTRGLRRDTLTTQAGSVALTRCGANRSRRFYRWDTLQTMRILAKCGGLGTPAVSRIRNSDIVCDISGGDSFGDLYGPGRFDAQCLTKEIALQLGRPLVLLPQTYGPYRTEANRRRAAAIVRRAAQAWARDGRSYQALQELLGPDFDPQRHRQGVDVAFLLETIRPEPDSLGKLAGWFEGHNSPLVGVNVSGLIYNDPDASAKYSLRADYREVIGGLIQQLLQTTDARILLVPHVVGMSGAIESDTAACRAVADELSGQAEGRIGVLPDFTDPREIKWAIAQLDWFCGTRMHSTIAALSSGVPTAALAYSLKTQGVFETCNQGHHVADPRTCSTEDVIDSLLASYNQRTAAAEGLQTALPAVKRTAAQQIQQILSVPADTERT